MRSFNLRAKLLAAGLLALAIPALVIGITGIVQSTRSITELSRRQMGNTAKSLAGGINLFLRDQIAKVRDISYFDSIINASEKAARDDQKVDQQEILHAQADLTKIKNAEGERLESILLIGKDRVVFASSDNGKFKGLDLSGRRYLDLAFSGAPNIGSVVFSRATGKVICIAACPIYASSGSREITGAVAMDINLNFLKGIIDEIRTGKAGYAYIVDQAGLYIMHPDENNILKGNISKIKGMETILTESAHGLSGVVQHKLNGIKEFAAFAPVPVTGWTVVNTVSENELYASAHFTRNVIVGTGAIFFALAVMFLLLFARNLTRPLIQLAGASKKVAAGELNVQVGGKDRQDEIGTLARAFDNMAASIGAARKQAENDAWLKTGIARLNDVMRGDPDVATLSAKIIAEMARYLGAQIGALYIQDKGKQPGLSLMGSYAYKQSKNLSKVFKPGEGLVGQAALEKKQILVKNVPKDYIMVTSGLGQRVPNFICVSPFVYETRVKGVVELGSFDEFSEQQLEYLSRAMPVLAVAVESAHSRMQLAEALEESQRFSEKLQVQQEELKAANEELEEQTQRLEASEEKLKSQQEELRATNEELEEKNELLSRQKQEVEAARRQIQEKAAEVALASKYKSEFLANMSHELRTPLNSLLLLAQSLAENKDGNLTGEQVEAAKIIHGSGSDLLNLINEILDLSKIEAGRMDLHLTTAFVFDLADKIRSAFRHVAREKGLTLEIDIEAGTPKEFRTDIKRVEQIVRNLVSNAIKFTENGQVAVIIGRPVAGIDLSRSGLDPDQTLRITVRDTGIGIAQKDQSRIFEAFQQSDGGTARKYGGTGLGLSISRELAQLLGGEIQLESEPGKGSAFTLYLPVGAASKKRIKDEHLQKVGPDTQNPGPLQKTKAPASRISDDRNAISKADRVILVIEDDPTFAGLLCDICHERRFKCLAAGNGETGLKLAREHVPDGIILDIRMPGMNGWALLDVLKRDMRTRHIPVHVISVEDAATESLRKGAIGHATKPLTREELDLAFKKLEKVAAEKRKRVLLVEDDEKMRRSVKNLIGDADVQIDEAGTAAKALEAMRGTRYGCLILDLGLPDMSGLELLTLAERQGIELPPVIVHTSRDLTEKEEMDLREHAESIVIKDVRSQERLFDEVSLFLHRMIGNLPEAKKQMIRALHEADTLLENKKVLIVDDDMRTVFAISRLLADRGMQPIKAAKGDQALEALEREPDIDLVLMDIMMPGMDGFEAIKKIRNQERFRKIPIIALTAKAMPEDRLRCIDAGANDYLPKPVDQERLISMIRVWLYR